MPFSSRDFWVLGSRLRVSCHRETSWEIKTDNPFSRWAGCCLHTEGRGWVVFVNRTPGKHWGISGGSGSGELNQIIRQVTERCVSVSPCLSVYEKILMETLTLKTERGLPAKRGHRRERVRVGQGYRMPSEEEKVLSPNHRNERVFNANKKWGPDSMLGLGQGQTW